MSRPTIRNRKRGSPTAIRLESLESRVLCAVGSQMSSGLNPFLTWLSTDIPAGSQFHTPPAAVTIHFDRALDPGFLGYDVLLDRVNPDGSLTSIFDTGLASTERLTADPSSLQVAFNQTLAAGHYEIFLSALSGLAGQDGAMLNFSESDRLLTDFQVVLPTISTSSATRMGTLGAPSLGVVSLVGNLDFQADPTAVKLYQITLPEGHFWRLGLEVEAQRIGSPLDAALAVFDSQGNPIATDEVGRGDAPADPYLYLGLAPGTYYVGVSGTTNLPGLPGGYSVLDGSVGSVKQFQPGGGFVLNAIADPADQPVSARYFVVDRADPRDSSPTGFTLAFSGALQVNDVPGTLGTALSQGVEVVDQNGQLWPIAAVGYNEGQAALSYLFLDRLPAGQYTVRLPEHGGLRDLAGLTPLVHGQPQGVLGSFRVQPPASAPDRHDLGPILPHVAEAGINVFAMLEPGAASTYRMVIAHAGQYAIRSEVSGGSATIIVSGAKGQSWTFDATAQGPTSENLTYLAPGVYHVQIWNTASRLVTVQLDLKLPSFDTESLLQNGVGQDSALALRLIAPTDLPAPAVAADSGAQGPVTIIASIAGTPNLNATPVAWWSGYYVGDWVGRPARLGDHVAVSSAGSLALNGNRAGNLAGLGIFPRNNLVPRGQRRASASLASGSARAPGDLLELPKNGAMVGEAGLPGPQLTDLDAIDENWLDRMWAELAGEGRAPVTAQSEFEAEPAAVQTLAEGLAAEMSRNIDEGQLQSAALTSPLSAGCVAVLVMQYRHQIECWLARLRHEPRPRLKRLRTHSPEPHSSCNRPRRQSGRKVAQPA